MRITLLAFLLLPLLACSGVKAETQDPAKVLMIGNSFTYVFGIPTILDGLCEAGGKRAKFTQHVAGDCGPAWHWSHPVGGTTGPEAIAKEHWDLVIMIEGDFPVQKDPKLPAYVADFKDATRKFRDLTAKTGTPVMLYSGFIWVKTDQDIKNRITFNNEVADDLGLVCAPTLQAVMNLKKANPNLAVTDDQKDGKYATFKYGRHQSPYSAYLGACTIYAAIYNQSPVGLKFHKSGDGTVIDDPDALLAQQVAWDTWKTYREEHKAARKPAAPTRPVSSAPATPSSSSASPSPPTPNKPASSAAPATNPISPPTSSKSEIRGHLT